MYFFRIVPKSAKSLETNEELPKGKRFEKGQEADDKEIDTASETPAPTKTTRKFPEAWKAVINTNGWDLMERKTKCSPSFVENSRIGKTVSFINLQTQMAYIHKIDMKMM